MTASALALLLAFQGTDFERDVAPVLEGHCLACHDDAHAKGGLSLTSFAAALRGGRSGDPVLVPGQPEASGLQKAVTGGDGDPPRMPKGREPLAESEVNALRQWIAGGAAWPDDRALVDRSAAFEFERRCDFWSLKPIQVTPARASAKNAIDAYVADELDENGLEPSPEADRRTLIRRVTYDLTGLPPTPGEIAAFLEDSSSDAYEQQVDRLLASPRFGERFARPWLDLVHFGETHGYDKDKPRQNAWPYRDWVIDAFNADEPYARFVLEQLAGDVLFPGDPAALVATGFIAAGPWDFVGHVELREGTKDKAITRNLDRDDMVMTTMSTFASTTVHCARCHDHKFDAITQEDYYSLQAVFAGVERADREFDRDPSVAKKRDELTRAHAAIEGEAVPLCDRTEGLAAIDRDLAALPAPQRVFAAAPRFTPDGNFTPPPMPREIHLLARGEVDRPLAEVNPRALRCVRELSPQFPGAAETASSNEGARRAALAKWLVDPKNPLVPRSIVNRVWQWHFGRGIVDTPSDLGHLGALPSHPELLDFLAAWFMDHGGSLKALHRLIVTSATYRRSSLASPAALSKDAENRLLARMTRTRLDAEQVHDALLAISGRLDLKMGGPSERQFAFKDDHSPVYDYGGFDADSGRRRAVYRFLVRSAPDPFMECLDCPDASLLTPKRNVTITALQALAMLNDRFVLAQCSHLADRVAKDAEDDLAAEIGLAFALALARDPTPSELAAFEAHARQHGLVAACRVLVNLDEFLFID